MCKLLLKLKLIIFINIYKKKIIVLLMHPVAILIQNKIDEYYTKKFIYLRKPNDYIHMRLSFSEWILWFQPIWEDIEEDYWQSGAGNLY